MSSKCALEIHRAESSGEHIANGVMAGALVVITYAP
jgi:hypothetical protein